MNINMTSSALMAQGASGSVGIAMLKKAIDTEANMALALINAIPQPQSASNLPPNLGQNINTTA